MTALAFPLPKPPVPAIAGTEHRLLAARLFVLGMTYLVLIIVVVSGHSLTTALEIAGGGGCLAAALTECLVGPASRQQR